MSQNGNNEESRSLGSHQRRTYSVDDYALQMSGDESYGKYKKHMNGMMNNGKHEMIKQASDEDYVCVPLARTNSRPSAKTCWRNRSVFAPSPKCDFGPKATLKKVQDDGQLQVLQDPSNQRLHWISAPSNILIIRKPGQSTLPEFRTLVGELLRRRLHVYTETLDRTHVPFTSETDLQEHISRCVVFDEGKDLSKIDLIICLGGDGTLLHVSSLFQQSCPPVLIFSMGSLGFLTPFSFQYHEKILKDVFAGDMPVLLRSRLRCQIIRGTSDDSQKSDKTTTNNGDDTASLVLNEVVIDRGPNSYLSNLDLFINDRFITKVQGDGLIISTPTGSTAYAMAAGASMVHPNVPAMIICPICPHSLSFRPIVVPAGIELTVKVAEDTRLTAWLSVDGRNRHELHKQNSVKITTSVYPVPSICRFDQLGDWFESLADILHWNLREPQSSLELNPESPHDEQSQTIEDENTTDESSDSSFTPPLKSSDDIDVKSN